jgi:hypothetical protein
MGCLLGCFGAFFPRLLTLLIWIARPVYFNAALSPLFAILGIVFLPFTTLMYVLVYSPNGMSGLDWFWVFLAFVLDIVGYGGSAYGNRDRIPYADRYYP